MIVGDEGVLILDASTRVWCCTSGYDTQLSIHVKRLLDLASSLVAAAGLENRAMTKHHVRLVSRRGYRGFVGRRRVCILEILHCAIVPFDMLYVSSSTCEVSSSSFRSLSGWTFNA